MKAIEVINLIMKQNTKVSLSEKQLNWIKGVSKSENRLTDLGYNTRITFDSFYFNVTQCQTLASGGSYVSTKLIKMLSFKLDFKDLKMKILEIL